MSGLYRMQAGVVFFCLVLAGCVSTPKQRAYDRAANVQVKSIEVLPMRHGEIDLLIVNNPGYSFGLIGLAIAEANRAPKAKWLKAVVANAGFDHVVRFQAALDNAMSEHDYKLAWSDPPMHDARAKTKRDMWGMHKSYRSTAHDALLDVSFGFVGYAAAGSGKNAPYRPTVVLTARLIDASGRIVLFEDQILYNSVFPGRDNAITLNPDDRYRYPDFDDLEAAGPDTVLGLDIAFAAVAQELAKQLRR